MLRRGTALIDDRDEFDLVVLGAGSAGMAAALFAALNGLKPLLIEKGRHVGGTTALSAGTAWVPNTRFSDAIGAEDSPEKADTYLCAVVGNHSSRAMRAAFLAAGPLAVEELHARTHVKFRARPYHPDYEGRAEGATRCGRAIEPLPFDGRRLGESFALLRDPIPELTVNGMMVDRDDIAHLLRATRSFASFMHATRLLARYCTDRIRYRRGTRLLMGNALCGRLLLSLRELNVPIWTETSMDRVLVEAGRVVGLAGSRGGEPVDVRARRGVVLASGGFAHHRRLRTELLHDPAPAHSMVPAENDGGGIDFGLQVGGRLGDRHLDSAFWTPVSMTARRDGTMAVFPHFFLDRGKPGFLVVNREGRRFVDETVPYHRMARAMYEEGAASPSSPSFLIGDHIAVERFGIGMVRPGLSNLTRLAKQGYVAAASSLRELAATLAIDAAALERTVARFNGFAVTGRDLEFGRGETPYARNLGDAGQTPNPSLGALETPPFYAVRLYPGELGTSTGLVTDAHARVLDDLGEPIAGLYACGNDMDSIMGGTYPGPGVTIGPALTFAYLAAKHAAAQQDA